MKKMLSILLALCMLCTVILPSMPAAAAELPEDAVILDVSDYGVYPENEDNAEAIQDVIEAAKSTDGPVVIRFPEGEYQFYPDKAYKRELYISNTVGADPNYKMKNIGLLFEDMEDVTVDGNGSLLMFHGAMMTFAAIRCRNITFQNLSFDFKVPSVIDITVESVDPDGRSATVLVPECYNYEINGTSVTWKSDVSPYDGSTYWTAQNALANVANQIYDAETGLTVRAQTPLFNGLSGIEDLGDHRLRFVYGSAVPGSVKEGLSYQMRYTTRDHSAMFFWQSEGVTLKDINAHFLYGFGIVGQHSSDITLDGVVFDVPEGSGRTTAGFADFVQMSGCKGEIRIENSTFANPHDDPINIHGTFNQVVERISDNQFKVRYMHNETAGFPNFFVGDEVEFMTKGNMIPVADSVATVTAVEGPTGDAGASASGTNSLTDIIITLDKAMPSAITANNYVVENITYTPSVVIRNNVFKQVPTRGILVTTRKKVEIRDNYFDGMGMASIYISNDAQGWYESGPAKDVTIEGNIFHRPAAGAAAIFIEPTNPTVSTEQTVHEHITIRNNCFYMQNGQVLNAKSTKDLSFTGNEIYRYQPDIKLTLNASGESLREGSSIKLSAEGTGKVFSANLYSFNGCKNVTLDGNYYDGGLKLNAATANMDAGEVHTGAGEDVVINGSAHVLPALKNIRYVSSDESILTVNADGTATGIAPGTATVRAYVPAGKDEGYYSNEVTITVTAGVKEDENAYLASAEPGDGLSLNQAFNGDGLSHAATAETENVSLKLRAERENAEIEAVLDGESIGVGTGSLQADFSVYRDKHVLHVRVTSPNGKKDRVYTFEIENALTKPVYLSDLPYDEEQSSSGYGDVAVKDLSTEGNPLRLLTTAGTVQTFHKGIGSHASCTLVYHIADMGFTKFSTFVGIDQDVTKREEPDARFEIYGDGVLLEATDTMYADTPMKLLSVNITGIKELKLVADMLEHNWSDHVDFADAKLIRSESIEGGPYWVRYQAEPKTGGSLSASTSEKKTSNGFIRVGEMDQAVLTAQAAAGYAFLGWYGEDGALCTADSEWTVPDMQAGKLFTARFSAANRPQLEAAVNAAAQKDVTGFTAESAAAFRRALTSAQETLSDQDAEPAAIQAAIDALAKAEAGLQQTPKPPTNGGENQTPVPQPQPAVTALSVGATFDAGGFRYQVTKFDAKKKTVAVVKAVGKSKAKLAIPATVKKDGLTLSVTEIKKNAFQKNKKLTGITIGKHVTAIGANAFKGCSALKNITFQCKKAPKIGKNAFKGMKASGKVTLPKKMTSTQRRQLKKRMADAGAGKKVSYKVK